MKLFSFEVMDQDWTGEEIEWKKMILSDENRLKFTKLKQKEILILVLCLLIGFTLRFYAFDRKSLWLDEIYTFNDSRDGIQEQLKFYKENPTFLQAPLFFILTHLFYPFTKPERDLHIIPMFFGTLSIPMMFFLSRLFSPNIAFPCALSLTFMTYHISLSQDGRAYSLLLFFGITSLYFFMKYLETLKKHNLFFTALFFASLFYTSYSSIPFISLSQILWFYRTGKNNNVPRLSSLMILNGTLFLICIPWLLFVALNLHGQPIMDPLEPKTYLSLWSIISGILHDWVPHTPLTIISITLFILFPFIAKDKKNALILCSTFIVPVLGLFFFCKMFGISHFITSRYFVNFLPIFLISLFLSLEALEDKFEPLKKYLRFRLLFVFLFIASNLVILPLYYRYEKQDLRGLVNYLKVHLKSGDKILDMDMFYTPGILYYFGVYPKDRHYTIPYSKVSDKEIEFRTSFIFRGNIYTIYSSTNCCARYLADRSRLWFVAGRKTAKIIKRDSPCLLKGYFDGSFLNFNRFPTDASIYLFLWDPKSPDEKGIDMPIE